jgi:tRNA (mo5U34)-methyltransferase
VPTVASEPKPKQWWQRLARGPREDGAAAAREAERRTAAARAAVAEVPFWWHTIEIVPGVTTPGRKTAEQLAHEVQMLRFPDLRGKRVLDIGGWDGFFALHAEQQGAAEVTVLDHYVWSIDLHGLYAQAGSAEEQIRYLTDISNSRFWQPDRLPGKAGFDLVRRLRGSRVRDIVADFMTVPLEEVGVWDVTLFLGVLYHLQDPLGGLRRLAAMTSEMALIESQAVSVGGQAGARLWEFYPGAELANDPSNWFAPTAAALEGALLAAGFARVEILVEEPEVPVGHVGGYRTAAHAFK